MSHLHLTLLRAQLGNPRWIWERLHPIRPDGEEMPEDMLQEENEEEEEMLDQLLTQYDNWERSQGGLPDLHNACGQLVRLPDRTMPSALYPSLAAPPDAR